MWRFYINSLRVKPLFGMSRGAKMSLALNESKEVEALHSDSNTTSQECTTSGKTFTDFVCKTSNGKPSDKKSH
jgi:hypothetical protein